MTEPDPTIDFHPGVWRLFDQYVHGIIDRRAFLRDAGRFATGAMTAATMLTLLSPRFAQAQKVAPDDARLIAEFIEFASPGHDRGRAYLVRPAELTTAAPLVLVAHENRGLNPHIEDVARRFALEGYITLAPDALFPLGGYPGNEDDARAKFQTLDQAKSRADFLAAAQYLLGVEGGNGQLGAVGFCWGGGLVNWLATQLPSLRAAAPFYGMGAAIEDVPSIKAELLVVLAANDERINANWPSFEAAMQANGVRYSKLQLPGTQHGFHNDTTPRFHAEAAAQAWQATLDLFARTLKPRTSPAE